MAASNKPNRPKARVAKGFRDIGPNEIRGLKRMLRTIEEVYESYGFEPVEQPFVEYTDALGKFLPDQDRPNEGVFSFQDEDEQWLSLRYDLTAPLARYVAENQQSLPMPYRSYRQGWVFRNEKPGPGRFRQFMQFDADTVGTANPAADAEVCMMAADTMERLGIPRGQYVININSRKILNAVFERIGLIGNQYAATRLAAMRAIDKLDRLGGGDKNRGLDEVRKLLGPGRLDPSGDYMQGVGLTDEQIDQLSEFIFRASLSSWQHVSDVAPDDALVEDIGGVACYLRNEDTLESLEEFIGTTPTGRQALDELREMTKIFEGANYRTRRVRIDASIIRGLEYYTGPVFECELLMEARNEDGQLVRFGSVGGGGRYDDLVARFTGQPMPATGFSIGVSRLYAALQLLGKAGESSGHAPVVVLVMDRERLPEYQQMVQLLRLELNKNRKPNDPLVPVEMYLGTSGMKAQMKYADKRASPLVVIQGSDEKARGVVQIKDMALGAKLASGIDSREAYTEQRLAQFEVPEAELVPAVKKALGRI